MKPTLNRRTVKLSYRTMPNLSKINAGHKAACASWRRSRSCTLAPP